MTSETQIDLKSLLESHAAPPASNSLPDLQTLPLSNETANRFVDAVRSAGDWKPLLKRHAPKELSRKWESISKSIREWFVVYQSTPLASNTNQTDLNLIRAHRNLLKAALKDTRDSLRQASRLPDVQSGDGKTTKRAYAAATAYMRIADFRFQRPTFIAFFEAMQESGPFEMKEIWALKAMLQLALLEELTLAGQSLPVGGDQLSIELEGNQTPADSIISRLLTSLRVVGESDWKALFEILNPSERVLLEDPSGVYPRMDFESREYYRLNIQELASSSRATELQVSLAAIALSRATQCEWCSDPRLKERRQHVGYYIVDKGRELLEKQISYHPTLLKQAVRTVLAWPEVFYLVGIELLTFAIMTFALGGVFTNIPLIAGLLLLLLPALDSAVAAANQLVSVILQPRLLPKLDFSGAIPPEFVTLVAVPTLLLDEEFVVRMTRELEIRYLANLDPSLHFALLTDFPDSSQPSEDRDELVGLCSKLIQELNEKYGRKGGGSFFLFHRNQIFNASEGAWMGWERKRGKLVDLVFALRGERNNFPVIVGDRSILPKVRFVITLDSDTQLPRGTAHRLVATLAHPLNQAILDPRSNTVVEGYGVLQPRVGISIHSAGRSLLADLNSSQSGTDPYTRATSDVYQDLFGEGSFTGKGIFEVDVFHRVLAQRFPCNAILSHDLIEGNYARAGLVSDVEVIDDYPSHFSAFIRRKHRWARGDWQLIRWLFPRVPDAAGKRVSNPLGLVSRWKIFDNLRRSVNEVTLFLLLIAGWLILPGNPLRWTLAVLVLLLIPIYIQLSFSLLKATRNHCFSGYLKEVGEQFVRGQVNSLFQLAFLPHQTLVMLDAIIRTLIRLTITRKKLLEWETAAEAENKSRTTPVDIYLQWAVWASSAIGILVTILRPSAWVVALPFLALWAWSKPLAHWLNRPPQPGQKEIKAHDQEFLRGVALRTWRYFRQAARISPTGLVPDNIQEAPPDVARRISPTNLGLLLNSQLAALKLGYLTLPEFIHEVETTLTTAKRLTRHRGHFLNWHDTDSLMPLPPFFVSTVDSGNLACCLWTLKQGCLELTKEPPFSAILWRGLRDHVNLLEATANSTPAPLEVLRGIRKFVAHVDLLGDSRNWIRALPGLADEMVQILQGLPTNDPDVDDLRWWAAETLQRIESVQHLGERITPWQHAGFQRLIRLLGEHSTPNFDTLPLDLLPAAVSDFSRQLGALRIAGYSDKHSSSAATQLLDWLSSSMSEASQCTTKLKSLAAVADSLVDEMDFRFLLNTDRKVLSVGFNLTDQRLEDSCYDLLASEARSAAFIAIAKGEIPQESWTHLGRSHVEWMGQRVLLSWSGTMFEYLMPNLWLRDYRRTVLGQSALAAVRCQQKWAESRKIPWGVSEAAHSLRDDAGHYQYRAFGIPPLALNPSPAGAVVIAPYSTLLALAADPDTAVQNLRRMAGMDWLGKYGFYEAADFSAPGCDGDYELIRCWMAHHQGMSLIAVCNLLTHGAIQELFHAEPAVAATDLLLHERVSMATHAEPAEQDQSAVSMPRSGAAQEVTTGRAMKNGTECMDMWPRWEMDPVACSPTGMERTESDLLQESGAPGWQQGPACGPGFERRESNRSAGSIFERRMP